MRRNRLKKQALFFLPGTLCNERLFSHQVHYLSELASIFVCDLTSARSIQGMAQRVLSGAPAEFALAGLSMGGIVAMEIIRQAPERVTRLALLDTNPLPARDDQIESWRELQGFTQAGDFGQITPHRLLPHLVTSRGQTDAELVKTIIKMAEEVGPDAYLGQLEALIDRPDSRPTLKSIQVPTLVLSGRQDELCPVVMHKEMASHIPGSAQVIIEQCGHLSALEQPQAVTAVLSYWLQLPDGNAPKESE
jgi:pimeloyl-ACP methyl ester carboxylesterase